MTCEYVGIKPSDWLADAVNAEEEKEDVSQKGPGKQKPDGERPREVKRIAEKVISKGREPVSKV